MRLVGLFSASQAGKRDDDHIDAKGDVLFTSNSRLAVTYNHGIPLRIIPSIYLDNDRFWNNNLDRLQHQPYDNQGAFVSETRFGYTRAIQTRGDAFFNHKDPSHPEEEFTGARSIPMISHWDWVFRPNDRGQQIWRAALLHLTKIRAGPPAGTSLNSAGTTTT